MENEIISLEERINRATELGYQSVRANIKLIFDEVKGNTMAPLDAIALEKAINTAVRAWLLDNTDYPVHI